MADCTFENDPFVMAVETAEILITNAIGVTLACPYYQTIFLHILEMLWSMPQNICIASLPWGGFLNLSLKTITPVFCNEIVAKI